MLRTLPKDQLPQHVGVMLDGNRRWARSVGGDSAHGYRAGAANIEPLLEWCDEVGVQVVTLWLLSTDNLNRPPEELAPLLGIIEGAVTSLADQQRWRVHPVGALDVLPAGTAQVLKDAEDRTSDVEGMLVNVAVGYGGRREIADAVRSLLQEHAERGTSPRGARRGPRRRAHRRAPLHQGPARSRPRHPHLRRATPGRVLALAVGAERVLLLRGLLARLPPRRLPARHPGLHAARTSLRSLIPPAAG